MQENNSTDDLKILRNYVIGVAGFATTVSAILIQALHFPAEPTLLCVIAFACLMLLIVFLINRSEQRQRKLLENHIKESSMLTEDIKKDLTYIKDMTLENQKSAIRTELYNEIRFNPSNHDTILKIAEHYFLALKADWYMTNIFLDWAEKENVKLPAQLKLDREV